MNNNGYKKTLWALMFTIGLDTMGFLLVFPLFPALFLSKNSLLISTGVDQSWHYFYYALALAVWPLGNFFGTAFLGEISDRVGRKKVLLLSLFIVFLTYAFQAVAIYIQGLYLFMIVRFIQGFFGGNYDVAQAAIADISPAEEKARNMGMVALASSIGIIVGPILSALTTSNQGVTVRSIILPFWIAASVAIINLIWIGIVYQETYVPKIKKSIQLLKVFSSFMFVFTDKRVRRLGAVYFLLLAAWGLYVQQSPLIIQKLYHFGPQEIGYFFLVLGVGFVLAMTFLQPVLAKRFHSRHVYIVGMMALTVILLVVGFFPLLDFEWIAVFLIAVFFVITYGFLLAMVSNAVSPDEQGKAMGGIGAVGSLAFAFAALSLAYFSLVNILIPIVLAGVFIFASGLTMIKYKKID